MANLPSRSSDDEKYVGEKQETAHVDLTNSATAKYVALQP